MTLLSRSLLAATLAALAGCAGAPTYLARPPAHDGVYALGRAPVLDVEAHTVVFLDPAKRTRFVQNFGGGGAGVGVMFGPLGVAANIAGIRKNTEADMALLQGKLQVDPLAEFQAAAAAAGFTLAPEGAEVPRVAPYFQVVRVDDEQLALGAVLFVDLGPTRGGWQGYYNQQLPRLYSKDAIGQGLSDEQQAALAAELRAAFAGVIALARADANGELPTEGAEVTVTSAYLTPRFEWEQPARRLATHDGRQVLRMMGAVVSLPTGLAKIVEKAPAQAAKPSAKSVGTSSVSGK